MEYIIAKKILKNHLIVWNVSAANGRDVRAGGGHPAEDQGVPAPQPCLEGKDVGCEGHQQAVRTGSHIQ